MLCPCCKYESGLQKKRRARGKVENILLSHMQKLREALPDARKSIRKRENRKRTINILLFYVKDLILFSCTIFFCLFFK